MHGLTATALLIATALVTRALLARDGKFKLPDALVKLIDRLPSIIRQYLNQPSSDANTDSAKSPPDEDEDEADDKVTYASLDDLLRGRPASRPGTAHNVLPFHPGMRRAFTAASLAPAGPSFDPGLIAPRSPIPEGLTPGSPLPGWQPMIMTPIMSPRPKPTPKMTIMEVRDGIVIQREVDDVSASSGTDPDTAAASAAARADLVEMAASWASERGVDTDVGLEGFERRSVIGRALRRFKGKTRRERQSAARAHVVREAQNNWAARGLELGQDVWLDGVEWTHKGCDLTYRGLESGLQYTVRYTGKGLQLTGKGLGMSAKGMMMGLEMGARPFVKGWERGWGDEDEEEEGSGDGGRRLRSPESLDSLEEVARESDLASAGSGSEADEESVREEVEEEVEEKTGSGRSFSIQGMRSLRGLKRRSKSAPETRRGSVDESGGSEEGVVGGKRRASILSWGRR